MRCCWALGTVASEILGSSGIERIIEIPLDEERTEQLQRSTKLIEETIAKLEIQL